jgi:hypothetical protein
MSLLLTRHVDQYRIDLRPGARRGLWPDRLGTARLEPFADQVTVKTITLDDQHAFHGWQPR